MQLPLLARANQVTRTRRVRSRMLNVLSNPNHQLRRRTRQSRRQPMLYTAKPTTGFRERPDDRSRTEVIWEKKLRMVDHDKQEKMDIRVSERGTYPRIHIPALACSLFTEPMYTHQVLIEHSINPMPGSIELQTQRYQQEALPSKVKIMHQLDCDSVALAQIPFRRNHSIHHLRDPLRGTR